MHGNIRGIHMQKKRICFLLVCLFLTGCSSNKTELPVENTEENQAIWEINKIQLPLEPDCSVGSYCVDGDTVYYSVYMPVGDYEENQDAQFDVSMETEIWSYDTQSATEKLLYKYHAGYQVDVNDMGICNDKLYWLDSAGAEDEWYRVVAIFPDESDDVEILFTSKDISESCTMITPETDGENIYFYAEDDGTVSICEYAQGKLKTV
jgi:hypothetical protein